LSACAATPAKPSSVDTDKLLNEIALSDIDLSTTHDAGPVKCPDAIGSAKFDKIINFDPANTNVGCVYSGENIFYTLYAYDQKGRSLYDEVQGVVNTVLVTKKEWQVTYDKDVSKTCALDALLRGAVLKKTDSNVTIDPDEPIGDVDGYDYGVGVMTGGDVVTIAAVHTRDDVFFKIRASVMDEDGFDEAAVINECGRVARAMRVLDASYDPDKKDASDHPASNI